MTEQPLSHTQALERLLVGNRRYVAMRQLHPRQTLSQRQKLVEGQHPFAVVLSCSDSRVPSELIFDQGLGDLFIVRTAGHVVNDLVLASIEYAVFALEVPLVLVLGHSQCGAVAAVMGGQMLPGHLPGLADYLRPALAGVNTQAENGVEQAVQANVRYTAAYLLAHSAVLQAAAAADRLRVAAGYYELNTGAVQLLD
jgi:carbonic anhydrase